VKTEFDCAMDRAESLFEVPRITDPLGLHWRQPDRSEILFEDNNAIMTRTTFNKLCEYSGSFPSGVYEGKMWRRHDGGFDRAFRARGGKPTWKLVWYGVSRKGPDFVSNNFRDIIIVEDGAPDEGCSCCVGGTRNATSSS
jgi:hypothetical protein